MSKALYRTYRPQTFAELTGQEHVKITLQNEIASDKVAHAYIFCGPRGVGKTTAARLLAKAVNCEKRKEGSAEPCGKCNACTELLTGSDLDVVEIDAASHTGVDNVRENIIENARFTPAKRKYKVFIIDEVHMLSISAFNALLKLLEEPPSHAIFILATTESHKIPATIISRCQRFDFKKIRVQDIIERLSKITQEEGVTVDGEIFADIARLSEGCLRDAESLLGQILSLGDTKISKEQASLVLPTTDLQQSLELLKHLSARDVRGALTVIQQLVEDGVNLVQFTTDFIEVLRNLLLLQVQGSSQLDQQAEENLKDYATSFSTQEVISLITIFSKKKNEIKDSPIAQLPLELAVIEYCDEGGSDRPQPPREQNTQKTSPNEVSETPQPTMTASEVGFEQKPLQSTSEELKNETQESVQEESHMDSSVTLSVTVEDIKQRWNEFLIKLQDINASLTFILKVAEPMGIEGNKLSIGLQYAFHQKRLMDPIMKQAVEEGLFLVFGERMVCAPMLLDKDYSSDFIQEHTRGDEVEFVQEITKEQVEELVQEGGAKEIKEEAEPPKESSDSQDIANEMVEKLVEAFGGKIVE